ncbi:BrnT family toxin [Geobacter grbiciae]|uniref:BrnT family toxin n=1 Tax=Geobacter grbiciae TaxID=155042 RepID=UPI001C02726F|nr:BrnT family toxin [Geobacter grbiciae]MBT1076538.1 BrnT family toxin [Geobacter grbiciae]
MKITFDPNKAATNYRKHGIRFSDAEPVLFDPMALKREGKDADGEQKFVSIGVDAIGRVLVVVFTYRGEEIRLISARPATVKERKCYES